MIETNLAPGLLLAMPHLLDPNFARAVVLMIEHDDEGSFGLVINQPTEIGTEQLFGSLEVTWRGSSEALVWRGGPVMPSVCWVLHEPCAELPASHAVSAAERPSLASLEGGGTLEVAPDIMLSSGSLDVLRTVATTPPGQLRIVLGYAGWGAGQLAQEMAQGSWLHADASPDLVFETPSDEMWECAVRSVGIDPENIVHGAGIH